MFTNFCGSLNVSSVLLENRTLELLCLGGLCFVDLPPPIAAPSMWTRKDLKEFKDSLRKDTDSVIKVGSGETVTVSTENYSPAPRD